MSFYARSAPFYDALYRALGKDYAAESAIVHAIIASHRNAPGGNLLDVGCGTGAHLEHLQQWYACEGLDADRSMLNLAAQRCPEIRLHLGDMISFNLEQRFDAIVCLFSAIGYVPNAARLDQTLATFARHLRPGGVAIVEPWVTPDRWIDGHVDALFADEPGVKVARMSVSRRDGNVSILNFHYMIAQTDGVRTFNEAHRVTLFTPLEYRHAFSQAGFTVEHDERGLGSERGLFVGTLAGG
ncbi:MAG: class I SAM-dependent DNA methyltransferase [Vulcanimicrobiaceae bacterium]